MGAHLHTIEVRFGECDPAGVVYFPRYFDWFHQAMETWFGACLGVPYAELVRDEKIGFPTVKTECEYLAPCAYGERVSVELTLAEIRRRSLTLAYVVRGPSGDERARGRTVVVTADLSVPGRLVALPLPDDLRAAMEAFAAA